MLSYQHGFHAGGPADVHKHAILAIVLDHLRVKPKPFCVVDLFAGRAIYDLAADQARKTREFEAGIGCGYGEATPPRSLASYFAAIRWTNGGAGLHRYPGSPEIARLALRDGDQLFVNELHPAEHDALERWSRCDDRVHVHRRDGVEALGALLPPPIKRGLAVVDPAFEMKEEYVSIPNAVANAHRKWPQGCFLIWFPILAEARHRSSIDALHREIDAPMLSSTMMFPARRDAGLKGSLVTLINPPWEIESRLDEALGWLAAHTLEPLGATHERSWLRPRT
ncbi:MAG: 23S rRNA (adenine(2030)-N(6))-methyltransferase RlmJ [Rhodobacteraceae bacterium]|nr:23S rRNA (adenine(2030)-N(6))-methyltransferase RlmJ [Paracoccaceae bacterium]